MFNSDDRQRNQDFLEAMHQSFHPGPPSLPSDAIIVELSPVQNASICSGCGGYDANRQPTGGQDLRHFRLRTGSQSTTMLTYCQECAEMIALFLIQAWEEQPMLEDWNSVIRRNELADTILAIIKSGGNNWTGEEGIMQALSQRRIVCSKEEYDDATCLLIEERKVEGTYNFRAVDR